MEQNPQQDEVRNTQKIMGMFAKIVSLVCSIASLALIPAFLELRACSIRLDVYLVLFLSLLMLYVAVPAYFFFLRRPIYVFPPLEWRRIGMLVHLQIGLIAFSVFPEMWMVIKLKSYCRSEVRVGILVLIYIEYGLTALASVLWLALLVAFLVMFIREEKPKLARRNSLRREVVQIWRELGAQNRWNMILKSQPGYRRWTARGKLRQAYFLQEELLVRQYLSWRCRENSSDEEDLKAFACGVCSMPFCSGSRVTAVPHKEAQKRPIEYFHTKCWLIQSINNYAQLSEGKSATIRRGILSIIDEMFPEMKGDKSKLPRFLIAYSDRSPPQSPAQPVEQP